MSDSATTAWVNAVVAAGGTVSATRETIVDNLVVGLKADGVWAKLDRLWLFAAENTQSALIDLVALDVASAVNSPSFTADQGYAGNGTSSYIDTTFNPATQGVQYTLNTCHLSIWNLTSRAASSSAIAYGAYDGTRVIDCATRYDTRAIARTNEGTGTNAQPTVSGSHGHYAVVKSSSGSSGEVIYLNGAALSGPAVAGTTGIPSLSLYVCARNDSGSRTGTSTDRYAIFSAGGSLTATEVANFYGRLNTYLTFTPPPTTLVASAGSYTISGTAAALLRAQVAATGSYTITGTAAALLCKQVAAAGSYTITGATAALKRGHVAGAGSYTLTGTAATFVATANLVFPAAASSYTLTGSAAAFLTGGNAVLPTDPGAYTLTGTAAGFITVTAVTKADISFIGQTVTVRAAEVVPVTQASVLFAGKTITIALVGTEVIPVGKGDILFTGQNIVISTTGEQPPLLGGGGVTVPPWRDLARKKRRRYRALEEIEKRLDQRIARLTAEARQIGEVVPRQTGELVPGQTDVLSQTVVLGQIDVLSHQDRQAQINQMLHEAQRRAEKVRQERIELDRLARIASEEADDEEAIAMLMRFL